MEISIILLKKLIVMFIYMMIGYFLCRAEILTKKRNKYLSNILLYIIFPIVIINSFAIKKTEYNFSGFLDSVVLALISIGVSMLVSHLIYERYFKFKYGRKYPVDDIGVAFSSAGFMGIPIVASLFGQKSVFYVSAFAAILTFLQWTYGVMVMADSKEYVRIKKIITNPVLISMIVGFIIYFRNISLPPAIRMGFKLVGYANAPVVMIILGVYLAQTDVIKMFRERKIYFSAFIRLIFIPIITMFAISKIHADYTIKLITMIAVSAPVGSNVAIFAEIYGGDYKRAVKIVCLSTILCVITMPIIIGISERVFSVF